MSSFNCCFLTCIQVSQEAGQVVWCSHFFWNFPQFIMIHTVEGFGIVNKAEIDVFLALSCIFNDPADVGNLISSSSAFSKTSLNIWKFTVHVLLKPGLENFEHYFTSVWDECNCVVVWAFLGIAFLRDWNENWPFPVLWPLLSFPNLLEHWVQHLHSIVFQALRSLSRHHQVLGAACWQLDRCTSATVALFLPFLSSHLSLPWTFKWAPVFLRELSISISLSLQFLFVLVVDWCI